jgi:CHAT domain-containing protein
MLVGEQARVDDVLRGAETATVLHLAAHGRLRKDNPLFSSVALADGPLTAYDLESLEVAPSSVLLPACNSGAGHAQVAEETLGLAWTLLGMGTSCVVAPLLPVPDAATHPFMLAVHEGFAGRRSLAESVARAQADTDRDDPVAAAVASTFVAFGD